MPTSTDVILLGANPLQVIVATSPSPALYWDDNNGHKNSAAITGFSTTSTVLLDDVSLASNGTNTWAYISIRELTNNSTTNLYILTYRWDLLSFQFTAVGVPLLIDIRSTSTDILDGMRLSIQKNSVNNANNIAIVWQNNGNILVNDGIINFISGSINYSVQNYILYQSGTFNYPGTFSNPDICHQYNGNLNFSSVAQYKFNNEQKINNRRSYNGEGNGCQNLYTINSTTKKLRTPRFISPYKATGITSFNEIDDQQKKSTLLVVANNGISFTSPIIINTELENNCTNNDNYKLTGFPSICISKLNGSNTPPTSIDFEVSWQQIFCNSTNFCTIQAISKRFNLDIVGLNLSTLYNNQYFQINNDLTKNSFFTSIASDYTNCKTFYSFAIMDKNTNANGLVAYKQSNCNGIAIRTNFDRSLIRENSDYTTIYNENILFSNTAVYPNPASDKLYINNIQKINRIEIISTTGILIKKVTTLQEKQHDISIINVPNGTYFIKLFLANGNSKTEKITIQH